MKCKGGAKREEAEPTVFESKIFVSEEVRTARRYSSSCQALISFARAECIDPVTESRESDDPWSVCADDSGEHNEFPPQPSLHKFTLRRRKGKTNKYNPLEREAGMKRKSQAGMRMRQRIMG